MKCGLQNCDTRCRQQTWRWCKGVPRALEGALVLVAARGALRRASGAYGKGEQQQQRWQQKGMQECISDAATGVVQARARTLRNLFLGFSQHRDARLWVVCQMRDPCCEFLRLALLLTPSLPRCWVFLFLWGVLCALAVHSIPSPRVCVNPAMDRGRVPGRVTLRCTMCTVGSVGRFGSWGHSCLTTFLRWHKSAVVDDTFVLLVCCARNH